MTSHPHPHIRPKSYAAQAYTNPEHLSSNTKKNNLKQNVAIPNKKGSLRFMNIYTAERTLALHFSRYNNSEDKQITNGKLTLFHCNLIPIAEVHLPSV
jgi:hypothetical protein